MDSLRKVAVQILSCAIPSSKVRKVFRARFSRQIPRGDSPDIAPFAFRRKRAGYIINGKNNRIVLIREGREEKAADEFYLEGVNIKICGDDNEIRLELPLSIGGSTLHINGSSNRISFSRGVRGIWAISAVYDNNRMEVGEYTDSGEFSATLHGNTLLIGRHCMFSAQIELWTDGHSVVDKRTKLLLNAPSSPVVVGDHVWIGRGVKLCKGAQIPSHSIVGFGSVVTRKFAEEHCVIAGNPAKVVREGISWSGLAPTFYAEKLATRKIFFICSEAGAGYGDGLSSDCPYAFFKKFFDKYNLEFCSARNGVPVFGAGDVAIVSAGSPEYLAEIGESECAAIRWGGTLDFGIGGATARQKSAYANFALPQYPEESAFFAGEISADSKEFFLKVANFIETIGVPPKSRGARELGL